MAGEELWAGMSEVMKDQYRDQARRAQAVLQGGKQVPWNEVAVTLSVVLTENSGSLTTRLADLRRHATPNPIDDAWASRAWA